MLVEGCCRSAALCDELAGGSDVEGASDGASDVSDDVVGGYAVVDVGGGVCCESTPWARAANTVAWVATGDEVPSVVSAAFAVRFEVVEG